MRNIIVKVHPSKANLKKKDQLAWKNELEYYKNGGILQYDLRNMI